MLENVPSLRLSIYPEARASDETVSPMFVTMARCVGCGPITRSNFTCAGPLSNGFRFAQATSRQIPEEGALVYGRD